MIGDAQWLYECPISACNWTHTEPDPDGYAAEGATTEEILMNALRAHFAGLEAVVQAHLETHPLVEWVREVTMLRDQIASSAPSPALSRPKWDACSRSEADDGSHSPAWYDHGGECSWCGNVAAHCPECGVILTMHHSPGCSRPCRRCSYEAGFRSPYFFLRFAVAREAEERDRAEWMESVKLRLGLVTIGDPPRTAPAWPEGLPDGRWEVISDHTLELPPGLPEGCRCVVSDGERVSLGGPCPVHSERPE